MKRLTVLERVLYQDLRPWFDNRMVIQKEIKVLDQYIKELKNKVELDLLLKVSSKSEFEIQLYTELIDKALLLDYNIFSKEIDNQGECIVKQKKGVLSQMIERTLEIAKLKKYSSSITKPLESNADFIWCYYKYTLLLYYTQIAKFVENNQTLDGDVEKLYSQSTGENFFKENVIRLKHGVPTFDRKVLDLKHNDLVKLHEGLKTGGFIDKSLSFEVFELLFSGKPELIKIQWMKNLDSLRYFVQTLYAPYNETPLWDIKDYFLNMKGKPIKALTSSNDIGSDNKSSIEKLFKRA